MKQDTKKNKIINIARKSGIFRTKDVEKYGIQREYIYRMVKENLLVKAGRGVYALPGKEVSEHITMIETVKKVPHAVVSLISALHFHDLTTQVPNKVWITIEQGKWKPIFEYPPTNVIHSAVGCFKYGIQNHDINGIKVRIYSPAKTVTDCFKHRSKVGLEVAVEALKDVWRKKQASIDELFNAAKVCRVSKIIKPYLEAIV